MSSWITPYSTWTTEKIPTDADFNRIEGNEEYLKEAVDANEDRLTAEEAARAAADTALSNRVTPIEAWTNQGVKTTDSPTFPAIFINGGTGSSHYTGSIAAQLSLPVGSIIMVFTGSTSYNPNAVIVPRNNGIYYNTSVAGSNMTGTWRARGGVTVSSALKYYIAQRIS